MRWWGWGDPQRPPGLPAHALRFLRETVGTSSRPCPPVALDGVRLSTPAISPTALERLRGVVGQEHMRSDRMARVEHAAGKSYVDLVRLRAGTPRGAPDAVAYPGSREQLRALLGVCEELSIAVVPFGGGTSVVGGVEPLRGAHSAVVALDMRRVDGLSALDRQSLTVTVGAGMRARALERLLAGRGLTLGHFPQSFEYVSLGGCAATRSAGQASSGYGRFEEMVLGLRLAAPAGEIEVAPVPASAAGPSLRELIVGSEGVLGVIEELSLKVRPVPRERVYDGVFFETFEQGAQALRELAQHGLAPAVARLSDETETRMSLALAGAGGVKGRLGRLYLDARGYSAGCLAILGFEEREGGVLGGRRRRALSVARGNGGLPVGASPGRAWLHSRFAAPYLRDELLTHGVMVETLETATSWSGLAKLRRDVAHAIAAALREQGSPSLVACHVSHLYETGASLYFTVLARQREGDEIAQWQAVKSAASEVIVSAGATISHHHAVGIEHVEWIEREIGHEGVRALRALKAELDPLGIMNPGKLLP